MLKEKQNELLTQFEECLAQGIRNTDTLCKILGIPPKKLNGLRMRLGHKNSPKLIPSQKGGIPNPVRLTKLRKLVIDQSVVNNLLTTMGVSIDGVTLSYQLAPKHRALVIRF